jgi:hypothetical protein
VRVGDERVTCPRGGLQAFWLALLFVLTALLIAVVVAPPYPPLQDLSEWIYQGRITADLLEGMAVPGYHLASYPIPNAASQVILGGLSLIMPAIVAGRIFAIAYLACAASVAVKLSRKLQPDVAGPLSIVLMLWIFANSSFWNGYMNFSIGVLFFAIYLLQPESSARNPKTIMLFSLLTFFSHAIVFAVFFFLVLCRSVGQRHIPGTVAAFTPTLLLTLWYFLARAPGPVQVSNLPNVFGPLNFLSYKAYTVAKIGPYQNFVFSSGGDAVNRPLVYWCGVVANFVYGIGVVLLIGWGGWRVLRRISIPAEIVAAGSLLLVFLVMPGFFQGVVNPGERFLYPALLLALLYLPASRFALAGFSLAGVVMMLVGILPIFGSAIDWSEPASDQLLSVQPSHALFWHRPTLFADKAIENEWAERHRTVPRLPLTYANSILVPDSTAH